MESANRVAIDTNMLLNIERFRINFFEETKRMLGKVEFVVPEQVVQELGKIKEKGGKFKKEVRVAEELLEKNRVKVEKIDAKNADEALKKLAQQFIISTNDKELISFVKKQGGKVLYLKQRKFLELN